MRYHAQLDFLSSFFFFFLIRCHYIDQAIPDSDTSLPYLPSAGDWKLFFSFNEDTALISVSTWPHKHSAIKFHI